jgi:hypothetical protein
MTGLAPSKRELETTFTHVDDEGQTHTFQILVPELVRRDSGISQVNAGYRGPERSVMEKAEVVQSITRIAEKNMSDRMPGIMLKAWMRALAKFGATEKAKDRIKTGSRLGNLIIGSITDAVAEEITRADIRCWRTLPARIHMVRLRMVPGVYDFIIEAEGSECPGERIVKKNVRIEENRPVFLFAEYFR